MNTLINVSVDVKYNSNFIICRHKLGQSASQVIGIAIYRARQMKRLLVWLLPTTNCAGNMHGCGAADTMSNVLEHNYVGCPTTVD